MQSIKEPLPQILRPRLAAVVDEEIPTDIWIAFFHVMAGKSVFGSYRCSVAADGRLFFVARSTKNKDHEVPFDVPLPKEPSARLEKGQLEKIQAALDKQEFFQHPGWESRDSRDGAHDILRVRREDQIHTVIYLNVINPLIALLQTIARKSEA